jgi:fused signal recognition particle receptor
MSFFNKLKNGLKKTRDNITKRIDGLLVSFGKIDEELFEELEEILITSDIGVETSLRIIEELKLKVQKEKITDAIQVKSILKEELVNILGEEKPIMKLDKTIVLLLIDFAAI